MLNLIHAHPNCEFHVLRCLFPPNCHNPQKTASFCVLSQTKKGFSSFLTDSITLQDIMPRTSIPLSKIIQTSGQVFCPFRKHPMTSTTPSPWVLSQLEATDLKLCPLPRYSPSTIFLLTSGTWKSQAKIPFVFLFL